MDVTCFGAAGEVTGSCHLVDTGRHRIVLDCGLFQGSRDDERRNEMPLPFDPRHVDAVVLSHGHLDHSGRLPVLLRHGYRGPIYCHPATIDLLRVLLRDAAHLEAADVERENRRRQRRGERAARPLFEIADVDAVLRHTRPLVFDDPREILPGVRVALRRAGHILGAASVVLDDLAGASRRRLVYSGDLGPDGTSLLPDPEPPQDADLVLMESTYGDRNHRSRADTLAEIGDVLDAAWADGGNLLVPSFAIGRAQELLMLLAQHRRDWRLDRWRIFLDSPMAIESTAIYSDHEALFHAGARSFIAGRQLHELLPNVHETADTEQSMRLNDIRGGALIIAGSGMCNGGRIMHHLKHNLWRDRCHVMIIGYQSAGTLGRKLVDGSDYVRIYGDEIKVAAHIHTVGGLSAHAGQDELARWYGAIAGRPPVALVHGEQRGRDGLADRLQRDFGVRASAPSFRDTLPV
jgi:metallo-beta-lactamase family protein